MKKLASLFLVLAMLLSLTACGGGGMPEEPGNSVYKSDIQEYIEDAIDSSAKISIFEKTESELDDDTLRVTCVAMFSGDDGSNTGTFTLTYGIENKEWVLEKCRVKLDEVEEEEKPTAEAPKEEPAEAPEETPVEEQEEEPAPVVTAGPTEMSDDWKDFIFELDGVLYQLPTHYQTFVANGWKLDGTRSDVTEEDKISGYSYEYIYLTNGATYFTAYIVNMSGNARAVKDCDIGGICIETDDNVSLKLPGGLTTLSTVEEIQAAYGTPSYFNSSDSYASLEFEVGTYNSIDFYIYNANNKYNEITLKNYVAQERDATTPKDERPAYLDTYVAPTALGNDTTSTVFELDGELYQLPCPLDAFLDNGWTVKNDSIGSLGAWNDEYGLTLMKGDYRISLTMFNFSDYETYTRHCAVSGITIDGDYFEGKLDSAAMLPGGTTLNCTADGVKDLYANFERYDGTYSISFTYNSDDYTVKVRYAYYHDYQYGVMELKNENWLY